MTKDDQNFLNDSRWELGTAACLYALARVGRMLCAPGRHSWHGGTRVSPEISGVESSGCRQRQLSSRGDSGARSRVAVIPRQHTCGDRLVLCQRSYQRPMVPYLVMLSSDLVMLNFDFDILPSSRCEKPESCSHSYDVAVDRGAVTATSSLTGVC
jgi:hypothetical protein